jgi:uncharacterized membrane protein
MYSDEEQNNQWHKDPNNWVWGLFYFNPKDKRLFLPKKINTFGITVNFANPQTYLVIAALILAIGLLSRIK